MAEVPNRAHDNRRVIDFYHAYGPGEPAYTHSAAVRTTQRGGSLHKGDIQRNTDPKSTNYGWTAKDYADAHHAEAPETRNYKKPF